MKRFVSILLALLMMLTFCVGCTPADTGKPTVNDGQSGQTAQKGGEIVFKYGRAEELQSFDMWGQNNVINYILFNLLYDNLIYYDGSRYTPGMAHSWKIAEDGLSITFELNKGIKFHNGEDCTAKDVAVNYNRVVEDTTLIRHSTFASLDSVEVLDEYTVKFNLNKPDGYFLMLLAQFPAAIPADLYSEIGVEIFKYNYGTGPWKFVSYSPGNEIVFERYHDYWGVCDSNVDKIIYKPVVEDTTRVSAVRTGDLDMADGIPSDQVPAIESSGIKIERMPAYDQLYVGFQNNDSIFSDYNARMAFNYGIDRDAIVNSIVGAGRVATWPCVAGTIGFDKTAEGYKYNLELAKDFLSKSGYNGETIRVIGPIGDYDKIDEILTAIYQYLTQVGFKVKLDQLQSAAFTQARKSGDYDLYITGSTFVLGDGYTFLNQRVVGDSLNSGFVIPELNEAILASNVAMDYDERDELMRKAYSILMENSAPQNFIFAMEAIVAYNSSVSNVVFSGSKHTNFRNVIKDEK